jgi:diacylglycerol O-acyltransferase
MSEYERFGAFDRVFLDLEDGNAHMHIGAIMIFDGGSLRSGDGSVDVERIRRFIGGRLSRVPRYRQRIAHIPVENHPVWVDDYRFDLKYHVRHISVPRPGDERQLKRLVSWINSQPLDRAHPLWEMWIIEGLRGNRFAIFHKVHHSMIDGVGGAEELAVVLSLDPDEGPELPRRWQPRPTPTATRLLRDAMLRRASAPLVAAREVFRLVRADPRETLDALAQTASGLTSIVTRSIPPASDTRLNRPIGAQRRFDWLASDLDATKRIKDALGGTVNDVVLATVAGALRCYFLQTGASAEDLREMTVRAMCPVNRRDTGTAGTAGNKLAGMFIELPVGRADPAQRLACVREETVRAKRDHQADAIETVARLSEWTTPALLHVIGRTGSRTRTYNLVITNVPGPQLPLFLLGAPLRATYPVVPIFEHQGLTIALFSYDGKIFWGLNADREIVPDLHEFADAIGGSLAELAAAAGVGVPTTEAAEIASEQVDGSEWTAAHAI